MTLAWDMQDPQLGLNTPDQLPCIAWGWWVHPVWDNIKYAVCISVVCN